MKVLLWIAFLMMIGIAIFSVQNSEASPVVIKFLLWKFETSLVYTILGSIGVGILLTLLFWVPREIRSAYRRSRISGQVSPSSSTAKV